MVGRSSSSGKKETGRSKTSSRSARRYWPTTSCAAPRRSFARKPTRGFEGGRSNETLNRNQRPGASIFGAAPEPRWWRSNLGERSPLRRFFGRRRHAAAWLVGATDGGFHVRRGLGRGARSGSRGPVQSLPARLRSEA